MTLICCAVLPPLPQNDRAQIVRLFLTFAAIILGERGKKMKVIRFRAAHGARPVDCNDHRKRVGGSANRNFISNCRTLASALVVFSCRQT